MFENDIIAAAEQQVQQEIDQEQVEQTQPQESAQERNFREVREAKARAEEAMIRAQKERDNMAKMLEQQMEYNRQAQYAQQPRHQAQQNSLAPDDVPEWKDVQGELNKLRQEIAAERQKQAAVQAETLLSAKYPDYREALTDSNIELLKQREPELWASIDANPDPYSKFVSAMKAVKIAGIYKKDEYSQRQEQPRTMSKPKASNALNPSPSNNALAQAVNYSGKMSEEERMRYLEEAQRRARGY